MTRVNLSSRIISDEPASSFLDSSPWVDVYFAGPSLDQDVQLQTPMSQQRVQPPPNESPGRYAVPPPNGTPGRRVRRCGISLFNQITPPTTPTSPTSPTAQHFLAYRNAPSRSPTRSASVRSPHSNNQVSGYSGPNSNSPQTRSDLTATNLAAAQLASREKRGQVGPRTNTTMAWVLQQAQIRTEEQVASVLEPGRSSLESDWGPNWPPRPLSWVSFVEPTSPPPLAPVMSSGWGHTPEEIDRTRTHATDSQLRLARLPSARLPTSRGLLDSPDDDADDERGARLGRLPPPFSTSRDKPLPMPPQDQSHAQIQNLRPRPHSSCEICLDVPNQFPESRPTATCTHTPTVCASCLEQYISHAVLTQGSTTLTCPSPECRKTMEYADVLRNAKSNEACLERYEALLLRRVLEGEPNFVWCKNPSCNWGQLHESGADAPLVTCQVCKARSCFVHNMPWHAGLSCEQYTRQRAQNAQEQASQAYIDKNAKVCPNRSCGRRIQKVSGCDHMTCRRPAGCGHEFCWICLADYDPIRRDGNHRHKPSCSYYVAIQSPALAQDMYREHLHENHRTRPALRVQQRLDHPRLALVDDFIAARRIRPPSPRPNHIII